MAQESTAEAVEVSSEDATGAGNGKRERSSIQFPYVSMEDAASLAKGIHEVGGNSCQIDQLAAHLHVKPDTGAFRLKLAGAKLFGFINHSSGIATLTPLGSRLCDPTQEEAARAEAFLQVPLYQRVYDQFKGASLPPSTGLEAAMGTLGVVEKQRDIARQVFQRSAKYAGYFWSGTERLVYPKIRAGAQAGVVETPQNPAVDEKTEKPRRDGGNDGDGGSGNYHPFIAGLLKTLPPAESDWPMDSRRKWLLAASHIFEVIYKDDDSKGSLRIEVQKESSR
jgi:hypothetical protein